MINVRSTKNYYTGFFSQDLKPAGSFTFITFLLRTVGITDTDLRRGASELAVVTFTVMWTVKALFAAVFIFQFATTATRAIKGIRPPKAAESKTNQCEKDHVQRQRHVCIVTAETGLSV